MIRDVVLHIAHEVFFRNRGCAYCGYCILEPLQTYVRCGIYYHHKTGCSLGYLMKKQCQQSFSYMHFAHKREFINGRRIIK